MKISSADCVVELQQKVLSLVPIQHQLFVGYPIIIAIMSVLQVLTVMYGSRGFLFFGFDVTAGWLILLPIMFYLFQIVAECYGWQYARQLVWCNFAVNALIVVITFLFKFLPFNGITHGATQNAYFVLLNDRWIAAVTMLFSMLITYFITAMLMSWSRFQCNGRHILLRIIVLHSIAEIVMIFGAIVVESLHGYSGAQIWHDIADSFYARMVVMLSLLPLVRLVIWLLQCKLEKVMVFDYKRPFSPFQFRITSNDSAYFAISDWQKLPLANKISFDCEQEVLLYNANNMSVQIKIF